MNRCLTILAIVVVIGLIVYAHSVLLHDKLHPGEAHSVNTYPIEKEVHMGNYYRVSSCWWSGNGLCISVTVKNNSEKPRRIPPFVLVDENGEGYDFDTKAVLENYHILSFEHELQPGTQTEGVVVFPVPQDHSYKLRIYDDGLGIYYVYVQLDCKTEGKPL